MASIHCTIVQSELEGFGKEGLRRQLEALERYSRGHRSKHLYRPHFMVVSDAVESVEQVSLGCEEVAAGILIVRQAQNADECSRDALMSQGWPN
jgi:hypothetical protein